MDTIYGKYRYVVSETFVFTNDQNEVVLDQGEGDVLLLYTCYPRTEGLRRGTQRFGVKCTLAEGYEYEAYQTD